MLTHGRRIYPSTLAERRLLHSLGSNPLYCPRGLNPFVVARRLARAAKAEHADVAYVRARLSKRQKPEEPTLATVDVASAVGD